MNNIFMEFAEYQVRPFWQIWKALYENSTYMVYCLANILLLAIPQIWSEVLSLIKQLLSFKGIFIALSIYTMHKGFSVETLAGLITFSGAGTYKLVQDYQKYKKEKQEGAE